MRKLIFLLALCASAQTVTIGPVTFTGSGLNDATSGGRFASAPINAEYVVTISSTGTPDHFTWAKNGGSASSPVAITGSAQSLADGVTISFAATTGHTLGDAWTITATASGDAVQRSYQTGVGAVSRDQQSINRERASVKDYGAWGDGVTLTGCSITSGAAILTCPGANFSTLQIPNVHHTDVGKYISISAAGATASGAGYAAALGTTIVSVTSASTVVVAMNASANVFGAATVTYGTNDFAAIQNAANGVCGSSVKTLLFPPAMYVIGQHKTSTNSATDFTGNINWTGCNGTVISGYGATIYIDGSFVQAADGSGGKSKENTVMPFLFQQSSNFIWQGFTILGNKDLISRASGVTTESLTSDCIAVGGTVANVGYTLRDASCSQPQTDCYAVALNSTVTDLNVTEVNLTCDEPGRGGFSEGNINGWHLSNVHASNACRGAYGGFQPCHGIDVEPNLSTTDNILIDGGSTFTDNIGWDVVCSTPTKIGHVTVRDSVFTQNLSGKQQTFGCGARYGDFENNTFSFGVSSTGNNVVDEPYGNAWIAANNYSTGQSITDSNGYVEEVTGCAASCTSGGSAPAWSLTIGSTVTDNQVTWTNLGQGIQSQVWHNNKFIDTTGVSSGVMFNSGFITPGTLTTVAVTGNSFFLNGMVLNQRNVRNFADNHVFYAANGSETGTIGFVDLGGSQRVSNNDYATNVPAATATMNVVYDEGGWTIPYVAIEQFGAADVNWICAQCASKPVQNGRLLGQPPTDPNIVVNGNFAVNSTWTYGTGWSYSSGFAVASSTASAVTQSIGGIVAGETYTVTFDISSYTGSGIAYAVMFGGAQGSPFCSGNGTCTQTITAISSGVNGVGVGTSSSFSGAITNIRIVPSSPLPVKAGTGITITGLPYAPTVNSTAGAAITALTGDVTATGPGSTAASLASVGSAGSCGDTTHSCGLTFDAKGRETARASNAIASGTVTAGTGMSGGGSLAPGGSITLTNSAPFPSGGISVTKTVRASGGASDCTLIYTSGLLTGGSC